LVDDRRWMVVRSDGGFLSQREFPKLACVVPEVQLDEGLLLTADGQAALKVDSPSAAGTQIAVRIWDDTLLARDAGDEAAAWLSRVLGTSARLVRQDADHRRALKRDPGAPRGVSAAFADAYPFLLISEASLQELNRRLAEPLPMNRFRPNIVISGGEAFAEDSWKNLHIGGARFALVSPCSRCAITTTDQYRGVRAGKEPLRTLARFRRLDGGSAVYFGQNLVHLDPTGTLRVGDEVGVFT
jgi:uncharacterized protein YcbX